MKANMFAVSALLLLFVCGAASADVDEPAVGAVPEDMLLIPGGEFLMGEDSGWDYAPAHSVRVDTFYIDAFEVTNADYHAFCVATERAFPEFWGEERFRSGTVYPGHPVTGVSWHDAAAFAEWQGKRLPTEAEWEYAARGGLVDMPFSNGPELTPTDANYTKSELGGPVATGSYAPNGYGLYDALGNVCEWVFDRYHPQYYEVSPADNPDGPGEGYMRVIRGGGWHTGPGCMRVFQRNALRSNWVDFNVGFRCARDHRVTAGDEPDE